MFQRAGYIEPAGTGLLRVNEQLVRQHSPTLRIAQKARFFVVELLRATHDRSPFVDTPASRTDQILTHLGKVQIPHPG